MEESQITSAPKRRPNFSDEEIFAILFGVSDRKRLLLGKLDNTNTAKLKMRGWDEVATAVNTVSSVQRGSLEVRKKFYDLRTIVKKKAASEKTHAGGTGN